MIDLEKKSLETWIVEAGYTQRGFAEKAGVSDTLINLIITGKRKNIRPDKRKRIADALGIQMRQIIEFDRMIEQQLGKDLPLPMLEARGRVNTAASAPTLAAAL